MPEQLTDEQLAEWEREADGLVTGLRAGRVDGLLTAVPLLVRALRDARDENDRMASVLSDVFWEQTGGRLSYPTHDARTVNAEINDARQQEIDVIEAERDGWRKEAIARRRAFINLARGAQLNESRLRAGIDINGRARDCIQAERDELRERLAAVEQRSAGRCGVASPTVLPGLVASRCDLRAGHLGWHGSGDGTEWSPSIPVGQEPSQ